MIDQIEMLLKDNWSRWKLPGRTPRVLHFVKLQSGEGSVAKRVNFIVFCDAHPKPILAVKTVRDPAFADLIKREHSALCLLVERLKETSAEGTTSLPLHCDIIESLPVSIETVAKGARLTTLDFTKSNYLHNITDWVITVHHAIGQPAAPLSRKDIDSLITEPIDTILSQYTGMQPEDKAILKSILDDFAPLIGKRFRIVPQHGDLTPSNVFVNNGRLCVIDFEYFGRIQLPLYDLFHFLERYTPLSCARKIDAAFVSETIPQLERYLNMLDIDRSFLKPLLYMMPIYTALKKAPLAQYSYKPKQPSNHVAANIRLLKNVF